MSYMSTGLSKCVITLFNLNSGQVITTFHHTGVPGCPTLHLVICDSISSLGAVLKQGEGIKEMCQLLRDRYAEKIRLDENYKLQ